MARKKESMLVVLSGGLDSTTLLYKAVDSAKKVEAISFDYGQRHVKELDFAAKSCKKLSIPHAIVHMAFMKDLISDSALTGDIDVPEGHYEDENMKLTVVPNRNMIMSSLAIGYAVNNKIEWVALGVHAGDHAIYPDCRPVFIKHLRQIAKVANYHPVKIWTPFLYLDKGDIAIIGKDLDVDYSLAWTCYKGGDKPCEKCGACQERAFAFKKAEINDPLLDND